jgi:hypothetical protein
MGVVNGSGFIAVRFFYERIHFLVIAAVAADKK